MQKRSVPAVKVSPRLAERLQSEPARPVEVVLELEPMVPPTQGTRAERMATMRRRFQTEVDAVTRRITEVGGEVLDSAWLNATIRSRIPAAQVGRVAADDLVKGIDLPTPLEAERFSPNGADAGRTDAS